MVGWHISIYRQTDEGASPATALSPEGLRLAVWRAGPGALDWLDQLVNEGKAINLGGDGYPSLDGSSSGHSRSHALLRAYGVVHCASSGECKLKCSSRRRSRSLPARLPGPHAAGAVPPARPARSRRSTCSPQRTSPDRGRTPAPTPGPGHELSSPLAGTV